MPCSQFLSHVPASSVVLILPPALISLFLSFLPSPLSSRRQLWDILVFVLDPGVI